MFTRHLAALTVAVSALLGGTSLASAATMPAPIHATQALAVQPAADDHHVVVHHPVVRHRIVHRRVVHHPVVHHVVHHEVVHHVP